MDSEIKNTALVFVVVIMGVLFMGLFGGLVVWACWDAAITVFPMVGLPETLSLWDSFKLMWLLSILVKSINITQKLR